MIFNNAVLVRRQEYYKNLFKVDNENGFSNFMLRYWKEKLSAIINKKSGTDQLDTVTSASLWASVNGIEGLLRNWVYNDHLSSLSSEDVADLMISHFSDDIRKILEIPFTA